MHEHDLLSEGPVLAAVADGGGQCEAISALRALRVFPRPLMNMSASRGFRTVANEMNMTLLRAIYETSVSTYVTKFVAIRSTQIYCSSEQQAGLARHTRDTQETT